MWRAFQTGRQCITPCLNSLVWHCVRHTFRHHRHLLGQNQSKHSLEQLQPYNYSHTTTAIQCYILQCTVKSQIKVSTPSDNDSVAVVYRLVAYAPDKQHDIFTCFPLLKIARRLRLYWTLTLPNTSKLQDGEVLGSSFSWAPDAVRMSYSNNKLLISHTALACVIPGFITLIDVCCVSLPVILSHEWRHGNSGDYYHTTRYTYWQNGIVCTFSSMLCTLAVCSAH